MRCGLPLSRCLSTCPTLRQNALCCAVSSCPPQNKQPLVWKLPLTFLKRKISWRNRRSKVGAKRCKFQEYFCHSAVWFVVEQKHLSKISLFSPITKKKNSTSWCEKLPWCLSFFLQINNLYYVIIVKKVCFVWCPKSLPIAPRQDQVYTLALPGVAVLLWGRGAGDAQTGNNVSETVAPVEKPPSFLWAWLWGVIPSQALVSCQSSWMPMAVLLVKSSDSDFLPSWKSLVSVKTLILCVCELWRLVLKNSDVIPK